MFNECLARPNQLLTEHLLTVAQNMSADKKSIEYICGLSHDLGKAHNEWQKIIRRNPESKKPPHSITGAAIFFSLAKKYFKEIPSEKVIELTLDILSHHSIIKDYYEKEPWDKATINKQINNLDFNGLSEFLKRETGYVLEINDINIEELYKDWNVYIQNARESMDEIYEEKEDLNIEKDWLFEGVSKKELGQLIEGDRLDASKFDYSGTLIKEDIFSAINNIENYCNQKERTPLTSIRQYCQEIAVKTIREIPDKTIYQLDLPTGYGKTLTALRTAFEACLLNDLDRIIYIAPYINVLSQSTDDIKKATKIEQILEHHHLSFVQKENEKYFLDENMLIFDIWREKIVTSTFNKIFETIFPKRANDLLRRSGMKKSFIILDEPQIVDYKDWEMFLGSLECFAKENNSQILLCTATCPDTKTVLKEGPIILIKDIPKLEDRYKIIYNKNIIFNEDSLIEKIINEQQYNSLCVILDTIGDVYDVYNEVKGKTDRKIYFLSGLMNSHHKTEIIEKIKAALKKNEKILVISTQMLEMGMDFSFKKIIRALSTIPSIIQTAGRVNRQGENKLSVLEIIRYKGKNRKEGRNEIYPKSIRQITDELIPEECFESETKDLIKQFYIKLSHNVDTGWQERLEYVVLNGNWQEFRDKQLFMDKGFTYDIFIPYPKKPQSLEKLMEGFKFNNADEIYDFYLSNEWRKFDYVTKKKFFSLLMSFTVSLRLGEAKRIVRNIKDGILRLADDNRYCSVTGLSFVRTQKTFDYEAMIL